MLIISFIGATLVAGILIGICTYRFFQNGCIPRKYLEEEKSSQTGSRRAKYTPASLFSPQQKGQRVHKAAPLFIQTAIARRI